MTAKEAALIKYLEFNLIGLIETIKPHLKDGVNEEEIFGHAYDVLKEMETSITEDTGIVKNEI